MKITKEQLIRDTASRLDISLHEAEVLLSKLQEEADKELSKFLRPIEIPVTIKYGRHC